MKNFYRAGTSVSPSIVMVAPPERAAVVREPSFKDMEEKTRLLIVFIRNPIKGMVKTRLAVDVGEEAALEIYLQLLEHVAEVCRELEVGREVHYSQFIPPNEKEHWQGFINKLQQGKDLGERMEHAF